MVRSPVWNDRDLEKLEKEREKKRKGEEKKKKKNCWSINKSQKQKISVENAQDFRVEKSFARATGSFVGDAARPTEDPVGRVADIRQRARAGPARRLDR